MPEVLHDIDIRATLQRSLIHAHGDAAIVQELEICGGQARADLVLFNGSIHGYEIKSDVDTLSRLPGQSSAYERCFEFSTLVSGPRHLESATSLLPNWWGLVEANQSGSHIVLTERRRPERNPRLDGCAVAALLWRSELLSVLQSLGLEQGLRSKPTRFLVERLNEKLSAAAIANHTRRVIKSRGDWRVGARRKQNGARSRRSPISVHSKGRGLPNIPICTGRPN